MKKWRMVLLTVIILAGVLVPTALAQGPNLPSRMYPGDWRRVSPRLPYPPPETPPDTEPPETLPPIKIPIPGHQPDGGTGFRMPRFRLPRMGNPAAQGAVSTLTDSDGLDGTGIALAQRFGGSWTDVPQWIDRAGLSQGVARFGLR